MNRPKQLLILPALFLLALMQACYPPGPTPETPKVASLKEHLPELEKVAKDWHPDAFLTWADVSLDGPNSDLLSAAFATDSITDTLFLRLGRDGEIKSKILENSKKQLNLPIHVEELKIDSSEALGILLDEEGKRYLATSEHRMCSILDLRREPTIPGYPILWKFHLWDCSTRDNNYLYINATTGERVVVNK